MCGIFGLWHGDGTAICVDEVVRITASLSHRGPDDEGYYVGNTTQGQYHACAGADTLPELQLPSIQRFRGDANDLALGFRRLSILDLSAAGHQPMSTPDGRFTVILNGEIYNYLELRDELARQGAVFRSHSDTEVLLAAIAKWGREALNRLVGMFAMAVLDRAGPSLLLARDFFGIKPLYIARTKGRFAFASEIGALLQLRWVGRKVHPQRLYDYLRFGLTDDGGRTLLADIEQIPAGHMLEIRPGDDLAAQPQRYWRIDANSQTELSFEDAATRLRELFLDSVSVHLRSDVPVGACLSGGIDSSAIVMAMRHLAANADIHTFSYCADDETVGEEKWGDLVAQQARATVHKTRIDASHLQNDLSQLIETQHEPFGSTSIYAQHRVFRLAQQAGLKVMLDGQGADELLGGYRPYLAARLASLARRGNWAEAAGVFRQFCRLPGVAMPELLRQTGGLLTPDALQDIVRSVAGRKRVPSWLDRRWFDRQGVRYDLHWTSKGPNVLREKLLEAFTRTSLPMLLRYEDRNSMAYSIESRVPFLTPALAQFVFSLPEDYLIIADGTTKAVFRAAMRGIVPDAVLDRRDKIGFATPERNWLGTLRPWVDEILGSEAAARIPAMNIRKVRQEWSRLREGRGRFDFRFWRWINLITWASRLNIEFEG